MDKTVNTRNEGNADPSSARENDISSPRIIIPMVCAGMAITLLTVLMVLSQASRRLPEVAEARLPVLYAIPPFALTNQDHRAVSLADLRGRAWVANIVFTRCPGPCPRITRRMNEIQSLLPPNAPVKLVTLTTDPVNDTPEVLRDYGKRFGAMFDRWWFLTGEKRALANLAIDGFKFVASEKPPEERTSPMDLFVHSTCFLLVDKEGRVRAVYHFEDPGMKESLLRDIALLLGESSGGEVRHAD